MLCKHSLELPFPRESSPQDPECQARSSGEADVCHRVVVKPVKEKREEAGLGQERLNCDKIGQCNWEPQKKNSFRAEVSRLQFPTMFSHRLGTPRSVALLLEAVIPRAG